jgi:hypothetical protein
MYAQGSTSLCYVDQAVQEVRQLFGESGEFVDDKDEAV